MTDIISMLTQAQNKAQNGNNSQQNDSVASFFNSIKPPCTNKTLPIQIKQNTLESIERNVIPSNQDTQNNNASQNDLHVTNSPLAMFLNSNNFNANVRTVQDNNTGAVLVNASKVQNASTQLTFSTILQSQSNKTNANGSNGKETTKLITPNMLINSNNNINNNVADKKQQQQQQYEPQPLTKNQMMQALKYLIENDDEFNKKVHDAYLKSIKN